MSVKYYTTGNFEMNLCGIIPGLIDETEKVLKDILLLYNISNNDPKMKRYAFELTVRYVSKFLSVNQRTAELLVETALEGVKTNGH